MRTSAFAAAFVITATLVSSVRAEDDFSALLADLTFSDAPAAAEPLAVAASEPAEELKPVPALELPAASPSSIDISEMLESSEPIAAPLVALQDPVPSPKSATNPNVVDFNTAFALQSQSPSVSGQPSVSGHPSVSGQLAGHRLHSAGCQTGCDQRANCGGGVICRPRTKPNLPSSTLLQYFRSDACYTNVWDGYQRKCPSCHKHIHGTCDCFNRNLHANCGEVLPCAPNACCGPAGCGDCVTADCANCDVTCD